VSTNIRIEGSTRVVGIFGDPVDHSLSPRMHNAAFAALGIDFVYVPLRTTRKRLHEAVRAIRVMGLAGVNVTVPFKEEIAAYVDRNTETAKAVGAVNTIFLDGNRLVGDNTDAPGFVAALAAHGFRSRGKRALVVGAGGSAQAVVFGLLSAGAVDVVVCNRTLARAEKTVRRFKKHRATLRAAPLDVLDDFDFLETRQLVVNCTPLGLKGETFPDYDVESTPSDCLHFDLAYREEPTPFLTLAAAHGRPTIDGRSMLVHQGALAFKLFTGRKAPVDVMAAAVGLTPEA